MPGADEATTRGFREKLRDRRRDRRERRVWRRERRKGFVGAYDAANQAESSLYKGGFFKKY